VLNFLCRLLHNYKISGDSFLPGKKIFDDYVNNCTEKENYLLQEIEVGRILKEVFPEIRRVQRRVKGVRTWTYTLSKIQTVERNENTCSIPTTDSSSQSDNYFRFELTTANRAIEITREEKHVFAENACFAHAQNNKITRMASGHAHDTIHDVFPSPVCSGAHSTKSQLSTRNERSA